MAVSITACQAALRSAASCLQVLLELQHLYWELCLAGHPAHQAAPPSVGFAFLQADLDQRVSELRTELEVWRQFISDIHLQYPLTCFLNTQQLMRACQLTHTILSSSGERALLCLLCIHVCHQL